MQNIRECRTALGWTQNYLAEQMGVTQAAVARWESGENIPTGANLMRLADLFRCSTDEILGRESDSA